MYLDHFEMTGCMNHGSVLKFVRNHDQKGNVFFAEGIAEAELARKQLLGADARQTVFLSHERKASVEISIQLNGYIIRVSS